MPWWLSKSKTRRKAKLENPHTLSQQQLSRPPEDPLDDEGLMEMADVML
jgi:hypothetical protein